MSDFLDPVYEDVTEEDYPPLQECTDCGAEFYSSDSSSACNHCLNNPYL